MVREIVSPSGKIKVYRNNEEIDFEIIRPDRKSVV